MNRRLKGKKAQFVIEYAGIIALTAVVLIAMHNYLNRGLQGKLKEQLDSVSDEQFAGTTSARGSGFETESRQMKKKTCSSSFEFGQYMYLGSLSINKSDREEKLKFKSPNINHAN